MKKMTIKGAIFDMDGTLVNSLFYWEIFWKSLGKKYLGKENFAASEDLDKKVRTMTLADAMVCIQEECGISASVEELLDFAYADFARFYREDANVKEGAFEFLDYLKARGIPMCVASATDLKYVKIALEAHGLAPYFDFVISCADIGIGKDQPDIYLLAKEKLGFEAKDLCVFEDSYVALETAKKAGFQTVGIFDRYNFEQERLVAASDIYLGEHHTMEELIGVVSK